MTETISFTRLLEQYEKDPNSIRPTLPVKERPIIFSAPMVRAILDGQKTQTRRVVERPFEWDGLPVTKITPMIGSDDRPSGEFMIHHPEYDRVVRSDIFCPYGRPGDRLWVRETWQDNTPPSGFIYKADWGGYEDDPDSGWKPSIFMPRKASRITLEIVSVRVERLQEISEEDADAEGADTPPVANIIGAAWSKRDAFAKYWERINGKKHPWQSNPWVWVIDFRVVERK